jgi:hypothetical protein
MILRRHIGHYRTELKRHNPISSDYLQLVADPNSNVLPVMGFDLPRDLAAIL